MVQIFIYSSLFFCGLIILGVLISQNFRLRSKVLLSLYLVSVFWWMGAVAFCLTLPTETLYEFPSPAFVIGQSAFVAATSAFYCRYLFAKSYRKRTFTFSKYDWGLSALYGLAVTLALIPEKILSSFSIENGYLNSNSGDFAVVYAFFILVLYFSIIMTLKIRIKQAKGLLLKRKLQCLFWGTTIFLGLAIVTNLVLASLFDNPRLNSLGPVFYSLEAGVYFYAISRLRFLDFRPLLYFRNSTLFRIRSLKESFDSSLDKGLKGLAETLMLSKAYFVAPQRVEFAQLAQFAQDCGDLVVRAELEYTAQSHHKVHDSLHPIVEQMQQYQVAALLPVQNSRKELLGYLVLEDTKDHLFSVQEVSALKKLSNGTISMVAEKKKYNEALEAIAQGDATKQKEFFKDLMHEVRHPLMIARSVPELIDWNQLKSQDQVYLKKSQESLKDLSKKLDRINDAFSWKQRARCHLQRTRISVAELIHYLTEDLATMDDRYPEYTQITCREPELESELLYCDLQQFKQALLEVCKNAFFFSDKSPPKLEIKISQDQSDWVFEFTDNGIGIAEKYWDKIFDLMFVISESRNEKEAGIGAGLTLARGILETHQGALEIVDSQIGEGTSFEVRLPKIHC